MKKTIVRLSRLLFGLFLYAVGIVLTIQAHIGYSPWDVFHAGMSTLLSMKIGTMTILVGLLVGIIVLIGGEKIGIGTISNMVIIGLIINVLLDTGIFPQLTNSVAGGVQMVAGLFCIAFASYFYISSGFGAGPRDSLMVFLSRKTGLSSGTCRGIIEISVTIIGYFMGGLLGWGTIFSAILVGFCVQITFNILHFDPAKVEHEDIAQSFMNMKRYLLKQKAS